MELAATALLINTAIAGAKIDRDGNRMNMAVAAGRIAYLAAESR